LRQSVYKKANLRACKTAKIGVNYQLRIILSHHLLDDEALMPNSK